MSHQGKTALVTGAAGGLGRAIAENFVAEGANVVICDINNQLLADFNEKVVAAYPDRILAVNCDITSEEALDDLFAEAEKKFGRVDYAVNSAGIMDRFDAAGDVDKAVWERVFAVNLTAPAMITKRAVNGFLKAQTPGAVVNIASVAAFKGFAAGAAYTASKHGLIGLTKNTAAFYRLKGIRCNAIAAGAMHTNIASSLANGVNQAGMDLSLGHFGTWEGGWCDLNKMAKLVAYLCSDDSSMINGTMITTDGGITSL